MQKSWKLLCARSLQCPFCLSKFQDSKKSQKYMLHLTKILFTILQEFANFTKQIFLIIYYLEAKKSPILIRLSFCSIDNACYKNEIINPHSIKRNDQRVTFCGKKIKDLCKLWPIKTTLMTSNIFRNWNTFRRYMQLKIKYTHNTLYTEYFNNHQQNITSLKKNR